ncbi:transporter substrate-binding domain-containing protein [Aureimonas sp. Leaf324]|uniref:transporter substrate-binding domain-containing protein n=1 Tax=Aureimonas sp. Leaf324 TaxID=1736336 RepID=UPI0006F7267A|nr:transporter substrate-binding domain-containing protein [Aureimonas sp. Leaf324]KQQ79842.1 amino acid ABC transporter [Aureimonas sp. Leaf324]
MRAFLAISVLVAQLWVVPLAAQPQATPAAPASTSPMERAVVPTPNFWDQGQRFAEPDLAGRARIRFLTSVDFAPFNFLDQRGRLAGFHVDLARMICEELDLAARCQIEARPFAELGDALAAGDGEAVIAGLALDADNRARFAFTHPFFRYPARFVALNGRPLDSELDAGLSGVPIGVVAGSAHEAMLKAFFPRATPVALPTREAALEALRAERVRAVFGDGVGLSFWLSSEAAADCCAFAGGPYLSDHFLGEGLAIAVKPEDEDLRSALDYAVGRIVANGRMSELLLRYFPVSAF